LLLLLIIGEQPECILWREPLHIQVLLWNQLHCSVWEAKPAIDVWNGTSSILMMILWTFSMFSPVWPVEGQTECSAEVSLCLNQEKPLGTLCSTHGIVTKICFEHFMHLQCSLPKFEAKLNVNALFLQNIH
jgi:hypothetical protein